MNSRRPSRSGRLSPPEQRGVDRVTGRKEEPLNNFQTPSGANIAAPEINWDRATAVEQFELVQQVITTARNIRAELKLDTKRKVSADCFVQNSIARKVIQANVEPVKRLAGLSEIRFATTKLDPGGGVMRSTALFDLRISHGEPIDRQAEIARLKKEINRLETDICAKQDRLADQDFRSKAPEPVVTRLKVTMVERQLEQKKLKDQLAQLEAHP